VIAYSSRACFSADRSSFHRLPASLALNSRSEQERRGQHDLLELDRNAAAILLPTVYSERHLGQDEQSDCANGCMDDDSLGLGERYALGCVSRDISVETDGVSVEGSK
jgi:hypothetical protein